MPAENLTIPFGFCQCGCGGLAPIAKRTDRARDHFKGQPIRFIRHHNGFPFAPSNAKLDWLIAELKSHKGQDCLIWPFARDPHGYGYLNFEGRRVFAHRLAFYLGHGRWPEPFGLHSCDTPACVNAEFHIFEGTQRDNMEDMAQKLRGNARKLTPELVTAIRRDYVPRKPGHHTFFLAEKYGVAQGTIWKIVRRWNWKHIP